MTSPTGRQTPRRPSAVATLVTGAAALIAFVTVAWSLPIDDFFGTLASGRAIATGADLAHAIPLTWLPTIPGALNPQWGAQLLLGAVDGVGWALTVNAMLLVTGLGVTWLRMRRRAEPAPVAVAALLCLAVLAVHLLARAQSFSIALFPVALLLLDRLAGRWVLVPAFGMVLAAWANLHGAFIVGQLAAGCWALGAAWDLWRRRAAPRRLVVQLAVLGIAVAAPLANPAGIDLLRYAYGQGTSDLVRSISVEWQPSFPWNPLGGLFWVLAVLVLALRVARRRSEGGADGVSSGETLLVIATAGLAVSGIRHIPWFVLAAAPALASDIGCYLARHPLLAGAVGTVRPAIVGRKAAATLGALALVAVLVQPLRPVLPAGISRITPDEPVALADALLADTAGQTGVRVLNEQVWGGYLAWRGQGRLVPAMDGRIEIRTEATWQAYFDLESGSSDAAARLAAARVGWAALFPTRTALISRLTDAGWTRVMESANEVLLKAP